MHNKIRLQVIKYRGNNFNYDDNMTLWLKHLVKIKGYLEFIYMNKRIKLCNTIWVRWCNWTDNSNPQFQPHQSCASITEFRQLYHQAQDWLSGVCVVLWDESRVVENTNYYKPNCNIALRLINKVRMHRCEGSDNELVYVREDSCCLSERG